MKRSLRGWAAAAGIAVLALAGAAVTAGYFHLRSSVQPLEGDERLAALSDTVVVRSDSFAIPHIRAASERDLFFAQGYVHAGQRLWQMELFRRIARGRLAEIFGEPALETDRLLRTLDLWSAAGRAVEALAPSERRVLEAYADGVNAALDGWEGAWPPEFVLLGIEPEPWTPQATAAVGKVMSLDLSSWRRELGRFYAHQTLPPEKFRSLLPRYPDWGPTILPSAEVADSLRAPTLAAGDRPVGAARNVTSAGPGDVPEPGTGQVSTAEPWDPLRFLSSFGFHASNNWALAGTRTESGHPIVSNDMHLGLRAPALWYVAGLSAGATGLSVAGLTLPGVPAVVVGFNERVAWSFTNGMVDDMDFAVEAVNLDGSAYRTADGWREFAVRPETIRVRGRDRPVVHRVRETIRGPVVSDALPELGATLSAMWTASRPTTELAGLLAMNRARTAAELDRAVRAFEAPHQNVVYAAADGTLGYRLSGTVPVRRWPGALPVSAREVGSGWPGTWPARAHPARRFAVADTASAAPIGGFVASANNLQAPGLFGSIGVDYPIPFRSRRIVDRLSAPGVWSPEDVVDLQLDTRSLLADRLAGRAVAVARRAGAEEAARVLSGWDHRVDTDARGASVFYAWVYRLRSLLAADEFRSTGEWGYFPVATLLRLLEDAPDEAAPWADDVTTDTVETLAALEERAMRDAVAATGLRPWGELHEERHTHPLGRVEWLDRLFGFHVGPYAAPGGPRTVRPDDYLRWLAVDTVSWRPPWTNDYGPSERLVVRMGPDATRAGVLLPTGQSGNPLSEHYRDMVDRWRAGGPLLPIRLEVGEDAGDPERRLRLVPGETRAR